MLLHPWNFLDLQATLERSYLWSGPADHSHAKSQASYPSPLIISCISCMHQGDHATDCAAVHLGFGGPCYTDPKP